MGLLGNFNFDDPESMGLLTAGLNMMGNSGRGGNMNTAQILAGGIGAGMNGAAGVLQARQLMAMQKQKKEHDDLVMQAMKMENAQKQQAMQDQTDQRQALMGYAQQRMEANPMQQQSAPQQDTQTQSYAPAMPSITDQIMQRSGAGAPDQMNMGAPVQPRQQLQAPQTKVGAIQGQIDKLNGLADYFDSKGVPGGDTYRAKAIELEKAKPKFSTKYEIGSDKNGNPINVRLSDDGTEQYSNTGVAEKLHFGDNGQQLLGINQYTGKVQSANQKFQTPESIASNMVSMRGQNLTDARAKELNSITRQGNQTQVINDPVRGVMLVDKGTGKVTQGTGSDGQPVQSEMSAKKEYSATTIMPVIQDAKKLISDATGSYGGMAFDKAAQFFGGATGGAQAIAKLKVLEGQLMMSQPRMEGPQSDKDVAMYRQMAGQIGDPNVPGKIKSAALDEIEKITARYSKGYKEQNNSSSIDSLLNKYK